MEHANQVIPAKCFAAAMGSLDLTTLRSLLLTSKEWSVMAQTEMPSHYCEKRFGISTNGTDISPKNLRAIADLMDAIEKKVPRTRYKPEWAVAFGEIEFERGMNRFDATFDLFSVLFEKYSKVAYTLIGALLVKYVGTHPEIDGILARGVKDKRVQETIVCWSMLGWMAHIPVVFKGNVRSIYQQFRMRRLAMADCN